MRTAKSLFVGAGMLISAIAVSAGERKQIPMTPELWQSDTGVFEKIQGVDALEIRFGDHLKVEIRVAPDVKYASVPSLFVQPLVENAIRHGISRRASGGNVSVFAMKSGDYLEIRVIDDGVGLPGGWNLDTSCGLGPFALLTPTRWTICGSHLVTNASKPP